MLVAVEPAGRVPKAKQDTEEQRTYQHFRCRCASIMTALILVPVAPEIP